MQERPLYLTPEIIQNQVQIALAEDIGDGDITALLIPADGNATGRVISREEAIICGMDWVIETFRQIDSRIKISPMVQDGDKITADTPLFHFEGPARGLLTGERTALNFLQTLSGTATQCQRYAQLVKHTQVRLLDTRKTLPGLRRAQKYAVTCGGCYNHRIGLYDAFLIKENHIFACGSLTNAVSTARSIAAGKPVEVEVENLQEFAEALAANADIIMLDNFSLEDMREAVSLKPAAIKLEASGGVNDSTLVPIAETGVDYISIGALTKDCRSIDLSMRFDTDS
ncbi:nicotinate-nucleotide pyrophosphorylase [Oleiphilus messinensis]|uniref:Probable nicotinate-nucleotide pyrophosphorylase [carboxylating] n=2 Tax=Oleiphilus messinensis TaxID=141451 RepID=A0A1Y0ICY3_9GAMM|nr:nicotinate-nucleotide pyrophosphorylase [Oleiphilus messinensis]